MSHGCLLRKFGADKSGILGCRAIASIVTGVLELRRCIQGFGGYGCTMLAEISEETFHGVIFEGGLC